MVPKLNEVETVRKYLRVLGGNAKVYIQEDLKEKKMIDGISSSPHQSVVSGTASMAVTSTYEHNLPVISEYKSTFCSTDDFLTAEQNAIRHMVHLSPIEETSPGEIDPAKIDVGSWGMHGGSHHGREENDMELQSMRAIASQLE